MRRAPRRRTRGKRPLEASARPASSGQAAGRRRISAQEEIAEEEDGVGDVERAVAVEIGPLDRHDGLGPRSEEILKEVDAIREVARAVAVDVAARRRDAIARLAELARAVGLDER